MTIPFTGDLDQYFDLTLAHFAPHWHKLARLPEPTPRTMQLQTALEAGYVWTAEETEQDEIR